MEIATEIEGQARLIAFAAAFAVFAAAETLAPRRARIATRRERWLTNAGLLVAGTALLRFAFPILAVGLAAVVSQNGWGVLGLVDLPFWLEAVIAVVALDFLIFLQHVLMHRVPVLWAMHKVHHADRDFDVTTALRFHPFEIAFSMLYKFLCILALGPSAVAVLIFEILLNAMAMFNHANWKLPAEVDRRLRRVIVTPDMHRVHHSIRPEETNRNFGFCLSLWDRWCGVYKAQPDGGHEAMTIGLAGRQDAGPSRIGWSLAAPFR